MKVVFLSITVNLFYAIPLTQSVYITFALTEIRCKIYIILSVIPCNNIMLTYLTKLAKLNKCTSLHTIAG